MALPLFGVAVNWTVSWPTGVLIGTRTIMGTALVLVSVVVITTAPKASKQIELVAREVESS